MRDMADSLEMWGVRKVYRLGVGVQAIRPEEIPERILGNIHKQTDKLACRIRKNAGRRGYNGRAKKWFSLMRVAHLHFPPAEPDYGYWQKRGWHGKDRPWRAPTASG